MANQRKILKLYWDGDECVDVTGGWDFDNFNLANWKWAGNTKSFINDGTMLKAIVPSCCSSYCGTNDKIDFSKYSCVKMHYTVSDIEDTNATGVRFSVLLNKSYTAYTDDEIIFTHNAYIDGINSEMAIDISNVNTSAYIAVSCLRGQTIAIDKIWLE